MVNAQTGLTTLAQLTSAVLARAPLRASLDAITEAARTLLPGRKIRLDLDPSLSDTLELHVEEEEPVSQRAHSGVRPVPLTVGEELLGMLSVEGEAVTADEATVLAGLVALASLVIERAQLERLTITDHLTLAYSARYLEPRLREEMDRAARQRTPLCVLLLDLDHFKRVNDHYGHAVGDEVLRTFVEIVRRSVRLTDVLVRRSGEEFVLLMPHTSLDHASAVAERIRRDLASNGVDLGPGRKIRQTVSIGVAIWDGRESPSSLEKRADQAMYRAKNVGRNQVIAS